MYMVDSQVIQQALDLKQKIQAGDAEKITKQHAEGKRSARERVMNLLDPESFVETDALLSDAGVICGSGTVEGRPVYVFSQDYTVHGGAMGKEMAKKVNKVIELARKTGCPVIAICDSAGVRADEGAAAMNAFASIYSKLVRLSGVCPVISLIMGNAMGGAAMMVELSDISILVKGEGRVMVYGPTVVGSLTGENLTAEDVGGADEMSAEGGVSLIAENEDDAMELCRRVLGYLPGSCMEYSEIIDTDDLNRKIAISDETDAPELMRQISDAGEVTEIYSGYGPAIRTGLCRIGGRACGLFVSDSSVNDGMIDADSARKAARLMRLCGAFDLPIVTMIDSKGVAVPEKGRQAETIREVSDLLFAYSDAMSAKVCVITGRAIGQSYIALGGKDNADMIYAWPGSEISALSAEAAVQVLHREELKAGDSRFELEAAYRAEVSDGMNAAKFGLVDDVIDPKETRKYIINALEMLDGKTEDGGL